MERRRGERDSGKTEGRKMERGRTERAGEREMGDGEREGERERDGGKKEGRERDAGEWGVIETTGEGGGKKDGQMEGKKHQRRGGL